MNQVKAAVFASGAGSNFQAMIDAKGLPCDIALLICDEEDAPVIDKAERQGIPAYVFQPETYSSKSDYEQAILQQLSEHDIEWIFLAGYMRIIGPGLLQLYGGRILNIHPSLLPNYPGLDAIGQALQSGASRTGVTVHYVDAGIDTGPIIMQETVPILPSDTRETLTERIHCAEHGLYIQAINHVIKGVE